jgi:hypothetical protein
MRKTNLLINAEQVLKSKTIIDPITNCWLYQGCSVDKNNKHCKVSFGRTKIFVHRISAHLFLGLDLWDTKQLALHKQTCRNPNCWNPDHLYIGSHQDNTLDSVAIGSHHSAATGKTHCSKGHEWIPENIAINGNSGKKYCKICNRERANSNYVPAHIVREIASRKP